MGTKFSRQAKSILPVTPKQHDHPVNYATCIQLCRVQGSCLGVTSKTASNDAVTDPFTNMEQTICYLLIKGDRFQEVASQEYVTFIDDREVMPAFKQLTIVKPVQSESESESATKTKILGIELDNYVWILLAMIGCLFLCLSSSVSALVIRNFS